MIADASREIGIADQRRMVRSEYDRLTSIIRAIDELLFSLEELNLQGIDRVPSRLRERAGEIIDLIRPRPVPVEVRGDPLRIRYRVVALMDVLFEAQDRALRLRHPNRIVDQDDVAEAN